MLNYHENNVTMQIMISLFFFSGVIYIYIYIKRLINWFIFLKG